MFKIFVVAAGVMALGGGVWGATYHVSPVGNDSSTGAESAPLRTVQMAMSLAQPGDTVVLGAGEYPETVTTARAGTATSRITLDGKSGAVVTQFRFRHPYVTVKNLQVRGYKASFGTLVAVERGAHYARLENCVMDAEDAPKVYGIQWQSGSTKPFSTDAASHCVITGCTVRRVMAITLISMMGENNLVENCQLRDSGQVDFFRLWGRNNVIRGNICDNNYKVEGQGNHPDFIQTFGNLGVGSQGHIIENNIVRNTPGAQLTQLEGNLMPEIGDWTFRNNIFMDIGLQASCTIPGVKYFNNVFYRCNFSNGGHVLNFGSRWYEAPSVDESTAGYDLIASPIASGALVQGGNYIVKLNGATGGSVTYDGVTYGDGKSFFASATKTYTKTHAEIQVWRRLANVSHNSVVKNNVFLECGDGSESKGWYAFNNSVPLTGIQADYNYVGRAGFAPVRLDTLMRKVGDPGGWDFQKWYEPNGINGGDPKFEDLTRRIFTLQAGSPLIDRAELLGLVPRDMRGLARPQGIKSDIGPFEFGAVITGGRPASPRGLKVVLTE